MKNKHIAASILSAVALTASATGGIDDVLFSIKHNNGSIKAAEASFSSDSLALRASNNLEDPKMGFEYNFGKIGDKWSVGVSQGFDWPGAYSARNRANRSRIKALNADTDVRKLEVLVKAKELCLEIVYTNRRIEAQKLILKNVEELYDTYSTAFKHGETSIIDINKLKIELITARQALTELETSLQSLKTSLKGLNNNADFSNVNIGELVAYPIDAIEPIDTYIDGFETGDPQNCFFAFNEESIKSDVKATEMGWLPKFDIGYKYTNELGDGFNGVTLGASIPIFSNKRKVAAAKAQAVSNDMNRNSYHNENIARIKAEYAKAVSLKSQLVQYGDVIGDESNFTMLRKALDGGQMSLLDYLLELRYFLEAKTKYLEIEYSYHSVMASLLRYTLLK